MGYKIVGLQNSSNYPNNSKPSISIKLGDKEWNSALSNYLKGNPPTDSVEWKKGIFAITKENEN